jgi:hypothetical protein
VRQEEEVDLLVERVLMPARDSTRKAVAALLARHALGTALSRGVHTRSLKKRS